VVFTLLTVSVSAQYLLTAVPVQLTRTDAFRGHKPTTQRGYTLLNINHGIERTPKIPERVTKKKQSIVWKNVARPTLSKCFVLYGHTNTKTIITKHTSLRSYLRYTVPCLTRHVHAYSCCKTLGTQTTTRERAYLHSHSVLRFIAHTRILSTELCTYNNKQHISCPLRAPCPWAIKVDTSRIQRHAH
ncbi:unnamed protein product, partial [Ectocarpus sp. 8 AP-2014]